MNFDWTSFLIGLILGWLLEWVIDWLYWRRGRVDASDIAGMQEKLDMAGERTVELETELAAAHTELEGLKSRNLDLEADGVALESARAELAQSRARYDDLEAEYAQLRADYDDLKHTADEARIRAIGRLTAINGIDEADAGRLYDAGIASSDDLQITDDEVIQAALGMDDDRYSIWSEPVKASLAGLGLGMAISEIADEDEETGVRVAGIELDDLEEEDEEDFELGGELIVEEVLETYDFDEDGEVDMVVETTTEGLDIDEDGEIDIVLEELVDADILDEDAVAAAQAEMEEVSSALDELDELEELQTVEEEADLDELRMAAAIDVEAALQSGPADDLTLIQGIGPRFSEKLAARGIATYALLAAASDEDLDEAIEPQNWQKVDYDSWRTQARTFAEVPLPEMQGDDLRLIEGIGPKYSELLREADILTFAELADTEPERLAEIIGAPAWRAVDYDAWIAQAGLAAAGNQEALVELQDELNQPEPKELTLIRGLGDTYAGALMAEDINTVDDLATKTPDEVEVIIVAAGLRQANFEAWIEEAKLRAAGKRVPRHERTYENAVMVSCPQDLESIEGVGVVYERRLYDEGVGSYWEVAQLSDEQLSDILEVMPFQDVDLASLRASALALAVESDSLNQVWDGTDPDDFEPLEGIGVIYERRLYNAGICTYEALAAMSAEQLEEICRPPSFSKPDFQGWIDTAQILSAAKGADEE
jgi:predicted flap endonuclease-1-like 5' DNA nuclease